MSSSIFQNIICIRQVFTANTYLCLEQDGVTIIDPGNPLFMKKVEWVLRRKSRDLSEVKKIILTHNHLDHALGAIYLQRVSAHAEIMIHSFDSFSDQNSDLYHSFFSGSSWFRFLSFVNKGILRKLSSSQEVIVHDGHLVPCKLEDQTDEVLECIHVPGHTLGSIVIYLQRSKVIFTGDALLSKRGKLIGPKKIFSYNHSEGIKSLNRLRDLEVNFILPGHYSPIYFRKGEFQNALDTCLREERKRSQFSSF